MLPRTTTHIYRLETRRLIMRHILTYIDHTYRSAWCLTKRDFKVMVIHWWYTRFLAIGEPSFHTRIYTSWPVRHRIGGGVNQIDNVMINNKISSWHEGLQMSRSSQWSLPCCDHSQTETEEAILPRHCNTISWTPRHWHWRTNIRWRQEGSTSDEIRKSTRHWYGPRWSIESGPNDCHKGSDEAIWKHLG